MNVGYFGTDLSPLKTKWQTEFKNETNSGKNGATVNLWNYELAPVLTSSNENVVSKHCIVTPNVYNSVKNQHCFFTESYYYHFNQ